MMHHNFPQRTVAILTLVFKVRLTIFEMDLPGSISPVGSRPEIRKPVSLSLFKPPVAIVSYASPRNAVSSASDISCPSLLV
jgi:hypothetical protein